jgi:hypothetical protein
MSAKAQITGVWNVLRILGWVAMATLLVLPFIAMQFTQDVNWTAADFIAAGVILGGSGLFTEFLVRQSSSNAYRVAAVLAVLAIFMTVWANLAVGMIGDEGNRYNLLFGGVILIGLVGMIVARFRPDGMALAMAVTATAQAAVGALGLSEDMLGGVLSIAFAGPWLIAAALFWYAAREQTPGR